jgi:hypothetical protein
LQKLLPSLTISSSPAMVENTIPAEGTFIMTTDAIQQQYDEVIAPHYDLDPQSVTGDTLDHAAEQIRQEQLLGDAAGPLRVYDVGMGPACSWPASSRWPASACRRLGLTCPKK